MDPEKRRQIENRKRRAKAAAAAAARAEEELGRWPYKIAPAASGRGEPSRRRGGRGGGGLVFKPGKRANTPRGERAASGLGAKTMSGVDLLRKAWSGAQLPS
jgi:hypothetical protein